MISYFCRMDIDNRISFFSGFLFTAATSINMMGWVQAAAVGLIGGFFGLLGKQAFYYVREEYRDWLKKAKNKK